MYGVVQFIENGRMQVLAVPMSWIQSGTLMWPKSLSNEKIDKLRREGVDFHGATKKISVLVARKFRNLQGAEGYVEELASKDVSDFETKKKQLKAAKKKTLPQKKTDYNALCEVADTQERASSSMSSQAAVAPPGPPLLQPEQLESQLIPLERTMPTNLPQTSVVQLAQLYHLYPETQSEQEASCETVPSQIQLKPLEITSILPGPDPQTLQRNPPSIEEMDVADDTNPLDLDALIQQTVSDSVKAAMENFGQRIEKEVERAVSAAVNRSFEANLARLVAMTDVLKRRSSTNEAIVEIRKGQIDTEREVTDWNAELASPELQTKYMEYMSRIIVPNSYMNKGDNACYTVTDSLFTRDFWTRFTWTGVNRGNKSRTGFRTFGNVTTMLLKLTQIGDPTYTHMQLEKFCKTRLFRHAKTRAAHQMVRKSTCRKKKGGKKAKQAGANEDAQDTEEFENESDTVENHEEFLAPGRAKESD